MRTRVWVVGLLLVGGACSDDGSDAVPAGPQTTVSVQVDRADAAALESYVSAMATEDVDAAMELRCEANRISASQRESFEGQLSDLLEETGDLGVSRVEVADRRPRVEPSIEGRNAVILRYWLTVDGVEVSEPLEMVVADEAGRRRLCGNVTGAYSDVYEELSAGVTDLGMPATTTLVELMPDSVVTDPRLVKDEALDTSTSGGGPLEGAEEGWMRMWEHTDGGATVAAYRYPSPADARRSADAWLVERASKAVATFEIPDIPGARGVRVLSSAWLWVQPPTMGQYIDEITMVFGDTVVIAGINSPSPERHHRLAIAQARRVVDLATASA